MLLIYCDHITPSIQYIFQFILQELCGFTFQITTDKQLYQHYSGYTLNYSLHDLRENDIQVTPSGFLNRPWLPQTTAVITRKEGNPFLFLKGTEIQHTDFDIFSASFYLMSRYEEYQEFQKDRYHRFEASSSVLFQNGVLEQPLVNEWSAALKNKLLDRYPFIEKQKREATAIVTIDVDQAFAFRHRGLLKNTKAFAKNLLLGKKEFLYHQWKTFTKGCDPYDTFDYLRKVQQQSAKRFIYFINMGTKTAFDKNLSPDNRNFQKLLQGINTYATLGLHPSFYSNEQPHRFAQEKIFLESAIGHPVTKSRQHYLKLYFPHTYRNLLAAGIQEDYTMGYANHVGFRAGTCTPFYWFDLENNTATRLKIFPITYMEGTLGEYLLLEPEAALEKIKTLQQAVATYNGCFVSLWHNHTVNDLFFWKGWKKVFEQAIHI